MFSTFLAHLTRRVRWAIVITWRPSSSSSVVRRKLFQKSSPLKLPDQLEPNFVWIVTRVSSFTIVSGEAVHQSTWLLLLKIEHMVKLRVNNIRNLTWGKKWSARQHLTTLKFRRKYDYPSWSYGPFLSNFQNFITFRSLFQKL